MTKVKQNSARAHNAADLSQGSVFKHVVRLALPAMLAQFVSVLYSIVDRVYIGNLPDVGASALAGVGICGPIITLISGFGLLVGVGGSTLMSIKLGEKDKASAKRIMNNSFLMLLLISAVMICVVFPLKPLLLSWFGATETTMPYADEYLTVCLFGTVFALFASGLNLFMVCQGYAKTAMFAVVIGAACNIALDPVFMFGLRMGVSGAAAATVLSQMVSSAFTLIFLFSSKPIARIGFGGYSPRLMGKIAVTGFSPFLIVASDSIMLICLNASLSRYGGADADMLITCATVAQSFLLVVTLPLGGITSGTQPMLGFNYGAKKSRRILSAEKYILGICLAFTALLFLLAMFFATFFCRLFTQNEQYIGVAARAVRISALMIIPLSFQYALVDGLTGMGITPLAIMLSMFRKGLYLALVFLLPVFFGAQNVFFAQPIADVAAAILSTIVYLCTIGGILRRREQAEIVPVI